MRRGPLGALLGARGLCSSRPVMTVAARVRRVAGGRGLRFVGTTSAWCTDRRCVRRRLDRDQAEPADVRTRPGQRGHLGRHRPPRPVRRGHRLFQRDARFPVRRTRRSLPRRRRRPRTGLRQRPAGRRELPRRLREHAALRERLAQAVGHPPVAGDVISFSDAPDFDSWSPGHVVVVTGSSVDRVTGDGTVTLAQENVGPGYWSYTLDVVDWRLEDPTTAPDAEWGFPYAEWLHVTPYRAAFGAAPVGLVAPPRRPPSSHPCRGSPRRSVSAAVAVSPRRRPPRPAAERGAERSGVAPQDPFEQVGLVGALGALVPRARDVSALTPGRGRPGHGRRPTPTRRASGVLPRGRSGPTASG